MTDLANYAENAAADHLLGVAAWTAPTNTYAQLHTGDPGEDCAANVATESTRKVASWAVASAASIAINAALAWPSVPAAETFSHFSVWDALTLGNPIAYGALSVSRSLDLGDQLDIASGGITIALDETMLTLAAANGLLDHMTGRAALAQPAGQFVKLHLGDPGNAAASNPAAETDRISVAFGAASGGIASNTGVVTWAAVAATEAVTHISVWDAATVGAAHISGALSATSNLTAGQDARFAAAALSLGFA